MEIIPLSPMPAHRHVHRDLVQFSDTDMAGIMHFSNFFRFMERAEHAFFRSLGLSVVEKGGDSLEENPVGWPRVHASCDFLSPLFFEDEVEVELLVEDLRTRSIRYLFRVRRLDGTLCGEGRITAVCVQRDAEKGMKAVEIPARVRSRLEAAPAAMLVRPGPA